MYGQSLSDCTTLWCTYALGASCKSSTTSGSALLRRRKSSFFPCARAPFWIGSCPNTERSNSRHERVDFGGKIRHVSRFKATRSSGNSPFVNNYSQLQHNYFFFAKDVVQKKKYIIAERSESGNIWKRCSSRERPYGPPFSYSFLLSSNGSMTVDDRSARLG